MAPSALMTFPFALFLQGVACWKPSTATLPSSNGAAWLNPIALAPTPTQAGLRRGGSYLERDPASPCAQLSGDASVSDYMFNCPSDQTCAILMSGYPGVANNNWGCCKEVPVPGCVTLSCPTYNSCIDSTALGSCNSECITNTEVLKCTNSVKPFCATASALITATPVNPSALISPPPLTNTVVSQYACADYPYTLTYTVFAEDIMYGPPPCAPPWVTNPASLAAWSTSAASQVSYATIQDFADPFDQVVASANFSASTVLPSAVAGSSATSSPPTVQIPTTAPATSSTTTSAGAKWTVSLKSSLYIPLLAAGQFLLS
ncbi:uncharacterized protein PAC_20019 [Phialocephala subalpina]|uniref:Uncharacterized protein n=1 Tax=Phialocephala subalpina TaxID=576137 RepID=A0A1L7XYM1_9HELO|nr:uncharacterized protein PAC_20019 [Phialocephala subalpina]